MNADMILVLKYIALVIVNLPMSHGFGWRKRK